MKSLCWLLCSVLAFLSACKRKRGEVTAPAAEQAAAPANSAAPGSAPSPPVPPVAPPAAAVSADHFSVLSRGLLTFKRDKQRAPKDWQELINTGYLKQMPTPPPGKRYTFNPLSLDVLMVPAP